jgi:hypothetical protein
LAKRGRLLKGLTRRACSDRPSSLPRIGASRRCENGNSAALKTVTGAMLYASLPIVIVAMLGYMFFHAGVSMRRDRVRTQRSQRRSRWAEQRARWADRRTRA